MFHDEREHRHGVFGAIVANDLDKIILEVERDPDVLNKVDAVGAHPVHYAFLCRMYHIGKEMVVQFPHCAMQVYAKGPYIGENILHIVIIHGDRELVGWLLDRHPELLNAETTGQFFKPAGHAYFGGYPLLFAVGSNQPEILQRILDTEPPPSGHPLENDITMTDRYGNNCLHLCVVHELPEMFKFCVRQLDAQGAWPSFLHKTNHEKLAPLGLAAAMGKKAMFEFILELGTVTLWEYGSVTCVYIPLRGLEQPVPRGSTNGSSSGVIAGQELTSNAPMMTAIECMCSSKRQALTNCIKKEGDLVPKEIIAGRLEIVTCDQVKQLLDKKWEEFGRWLFYKEFAILLTAQTLWTVSSVIPNPYTIDYENFHEYPVENGFIVACEAAVWLYILRFVIRKIRRFIRNGYHKNQVFNKRRFEDKVSMAFCVCFVTGWCVSIGGACDVGRAFLACAALLGWTMVLFGLLGFRELGRFVVMVTEMIVNDVMRFFVVYVIVEVAYTMALTFLLDACKEPGVKYFFQHMIDWILTTVGIYPFTFPQFGDGSDPKYWLTHILLVTYTFMVLVLLLNLLIAMMNNSYNSVALVSEGQLYVERANIMADYEKSFTPLEMQQLRSKYAVPMEASSADCISLETEFFLDIQRHDTTWKHHFCESEGSSSDSEKGESRHVAFKERTQLRVSFSDDGASEKLSPACSMYSEDFLTTPNARERKRVQKGGTATPFRRMQSVRKRAKPQPPRRGAFDLPGYAFPRVTTEEYSSDDSPNSRRQSLNPSPNLLYREDDEFLPRLPSPRLATPPPTESTTDTEFLSTVHSFNVLPQT